MTYAGGRAILDADSHVMELADFLDDFIDPPERDRLRRRGMDALAPVLADASQKARRRGADASVAARAEERLMQDKGWMAMGGFDHRKNMLLLLRAWRGALDALCADSPKLDAGDFGLWTFDIGLPVLAIGGGGLTTMASPSTRPSWPANAGDVTGLFASINRQLG